MIPFCTQMAIDLQNFIINIPVVLFKKTKQTAKDFFSGAINTYKGAGENFKKTLKGAAESARN